MRGLVLAAALAAPMPLLAVPKPTSKRPPATAPAPPPAPPSPPPQSPSIPRVEVTFRATTALVTTELTFERPPGGRMLFVAYGSPGLPAAFAAELHAVPEGRFSPDPALFGAGLTSVHAVRAPSDAWLSLGPARAAGRIVNLDEGSLAALPRTPLIAIRFQSVHMLADRDAHPRSVLARISLDGAPLPLGEVGVRAEGERIAEASAKLCGAKGDDVALALSGAPALPGRVAPPRARRADGQDLCIRAALK